jgi:hypothetical protein
MDRVDEKRSRRSALLASYLEHVGLERFRVVNGQQRVRVAVNGEVAPALEVNLLQNGDGELNKRSVRLGVVSRSTGSFDTHVCIP